jgi:hypothetical protein
MAIEKDAILQILANETESEKKADELLRLFGEDVQGLLINSEKLKNEKEQEKAKRKDFEEQVKSAMAKHAELEKQLSEASPDKIRTLYDTKLEEQKGVYEGQLKKLGLELEDKTKKIEALEHSQFKLECMEAFNKAIADKNIASDCTSQFADFVLGNDCSYFSKQATGSDTFVIADRNGHSIESAVSKALQTSFGKCCVTVKSSGGGAEGGTRGAPNNTAGKVISRTEFDKLAPTERVKLMSEGYKIG